MPWQRQRNKGSVPIVRGVVIAHDITVLIHVTANKERVDAIMVFREENDKMATCQSFQPPMNNGRHAGSKDNIRSAPPEP